MKIEKFVKTDYVSWMPRHCKNGNYIRAQRFIITVFHRSYYCQKLLEIQSCIERLKLWALHCALGTMGWNSFFNKHSLSLCSYDFTSCLHTSEKLLITAKSEQISRETADVFENKNSTIEMNSPHCAKQKRIRAI